jgi:hypothetical protein
MRFKIVRGEVSLHNVKLDVKFGRIWPVLSHT